MKGLEVRLKSNVMLIVSAGRICESDIEVIEVGRQGPIPCRQVNSHCV